MPLPVKSSMRKTQATVPHLRLQRRAPTLARSALCAIGMLLCAGTAGALESIEAFPQSALEIHTSSGRQWFTIRIADTELRQQQGLMYVRTLAADEGMLFPEATPRIMRFWMKNTLIPLDMLFITARGRIACLREQAKPLLLDLISCEQPVKAVLEIGGGEAQKRGIHVGDRVLHPLFHR